MPHVEDQAGGPVAPASVRARRLAAARLVAMVLVGGALAALFFGAGVLGPERVRGWIEPFGALGPVVYVPLAALLGTAFVPGAALAAAAGLLFGAWQGALLSMLSGTGGALLSRAVSKRAGHEAFGELAPGRVQALAALARRNGLLAVIVARLSPALPDAIANHAFGVAGLTAASVAAGHLLAAGPRALAYATVGANADDPVGRDALMGWALNGATGVVGFIVLAVVVVRHRRRTERSSADPTPVATGE